ALTALAGALASGASPYLATEIKKLTTNPLTGEVDVAANTMAHAVLGAVNWRRATLPGSCSRAKRRSS
ncbi:hypothetical protein ACTVLM_03620, partial [Serratia marcescens]|uniref:hypothetical protein n=1 Tax=Serratia marcescens TaxID=615 RepID=UPI003FA73EB2